MGLSPSGLRGSPRSAPSTIVESVVSTCPRTRVTTTVSCSARRKDPALEVAEVGLVFVVSRVTLSSAARQPPGGQGMRGIDHRSIVIVNEGTSLVCFTYVCSILDGLRLLIPIPEYWKWARSVPED